jgi:hypothetical protein
MLKFGRPRWYKKEDKEQERIDLDVIKEWRETFTQEMRVTKELMQEAQDGRWIDFRNEMESVKKEIRKNEVLLSDFRNMMDVAKAIHFGDECRGTLQNMRARNDRLTEIERVMIEMRIDVDKLLSMLKENMLISPAPTKSSLKMQATAISYNAVSEDAAEEGQIVRKNVPISKIPVRVVSIPFATPQKRIDSVHSQHKVKFGWDM